MTSQGRQDLIAIVCAFVGASVVRQVLPPIDGVQPVFVSIAGAALGLMLARLVFHTLKVRESRAAIKQAKEQQVQNDADFSSALFSDQKSPPR